jgi:hypothetical protein
MTPDRGSWKTFRTIIGTVDIKEVSGRPSKGPDRRLAVYRGMYLGGDESLTSKEWIETIVKINHGPLGALYPMKTWTAPNPHSVMNEGDTPSWFYFLPRGLNEPEHPEWGGWGGRFRRLRANLYNDATDTVNGVTGARASVWRWRAAFQNDFAARMDWCVTPDPKAANHAPVAVLEGGSTTVRPGDRVRLRAAASTDPDGDKLSFRWFVYKEAGSFEGDVALTGHTTANAEFAAPEVREPRTIHVILEVSDSGTPSLTSYRRAVITVR